jgi:hypothetical protein
LKHNKKTTLFLKLKNKSASKGLLDF